MCFDGEMLCSEEGEESCGGDDAFDVVETLCAMVVDELESGVHQEDEPKILVLTVEKRGLVEGPISEGSGVPMTCNSSVEVAAKGSPDVLLESGPLSVPTIT